MSYPEDWSEIALQVKSDASWTCVRCGHWDPPNHPHRGRYPCTEDCTHLGAVPGETPDKKRVLTVHHLDGNKSNCRWWNLPPLCQVCHLAIQGKVQMDQTYAEPHSEWFLPYVAGYYLWRIAGDQRPREWVEDHLVECLTLGQPHLEDHYRERVA